MAAPQPKKYILDNLKDQTIYGNLNIEGTIKTNSTGKYRALLTQTNPVVGSDISDFNYGLIIGETYTITDYIGGDDFSNISDLISGNFNETGCVFRATGETPNNWNGGTQLTSNGDLVVDVLENTLGYEITWDHAPFGGEGYYLGVNNDSLIFNEGPLLNQFQRNKTEIKVVHKNPVNYPPNLIIYPTAGIGSAFSKDSHVYIEMRYNIDSFDSLIDGLLYYTPVEITINQDLDITPTLIYGLNVSTFPYGYVSVNLFSNSVQFASFYNNVNIDVNNMEELITALNYDDGTNILGVYSLNPNLENGIILTIPSNLMNQLSPDGELTFEVFND